MRASIVVPTIRSESPTLDKLDSLDISGIELIERRDKESLNYARNRGVETADTDNIIILDDDLTFTKSWLYDRIREAERSKNERRIWGARGTGILENIEWEGSLFEPILGRVMVFDRTAWEEVGGFPEKLHHAGDTVFALKAAQKGWTVEQLAHDFEHHDTTDTYTFWENIRWLLTLVHTAPEMILPHIPEIAIQAARNRWQE